MYENFKGDLWKLNVSILNLFVLEDYWEFGDEISTKMKLFSWSLQFSYNFCILLEFWWQKTQNTIRTSLEIRTCLSSKPEKHDESPSNIWKIIYNYLRYLRCWSAVLLLCARSPRSPNMSGIGAISDVPSLGKYMLPENLEWKCLPRYAPWASSYEQECLDGRKVSNVFELPKFVFTQDC